MSIGTREDALLYSYSYGASKLLHFFHYIIRILQDNDCYVDGMTETFVRSVTRSSEHT